MRNQFEEIASIKNPWNRELLAAGIFLVLLGLFHIAAQLAWPRDWESAIGWRKPILFGISTGLTLISLSWVVSVSLKGSARLLARMISFLAYAEVLAITLQTWRGVPAHFNHGAVLDQALSVLIEVSLIFITLGIFFTTWRSFVSAGAGADWMQAIRLGMLFLSISCVLGFGVAIYGRSMMNSGHDPEIVSPRGVPKFVHGMPLHAIQIFPAWVWVLRKVGCDVATRLKSLKWLASAIGAMTVYALWQTLNGYGRFEWNSAGLIIAGSAGICAAVSGLIALLGIMKRKTMSK